jgi:dipeptidyl aminopeptidase/acylaminoacyl peptidase
MVCFYIMPRKYFVLFLLPCLFILDARADDLDFSDPVIRYVFTGGQSGQQQISIVDRNLHIQQLTDYRGKHHFFRISVSKDRRKIAFQVVLESRRFLKIMDLSSFPAIKHTELLHNVIIHNVSWSADDRYIALVCGSELPYQLLVMDTSSYEIHTATTFDNLVPWFRWSPQGHTLLFTKNDTVLLGEPPAAVYRELAGAGSYPVWDADGRGVIYFSNHMYHMSLAGTKKILYADVMWPILMLHNYMNPFRYPGVFLGIHYAPDRKKCILGTDVSPPEVSSVYLKMYFIDIEQKITVPLSDIFNAQDSSGFFNEISYRACSFSPDSSKLVCDSKGSLFILDMENNKTLRVFREGCIFSMPEFSADGRLIFFRGYKKGEPETESVFYVNARGGEIKRLY